MDDHSSAPDEDAIRAMAATYGIDLSDERAKRLAQSVARHHVQMAQVDRLGLGNREPAVADPSVDR
jgi:outer membrane protein OmpA-like peptidoglycan-associated protein